MTPNRALQRTLTGGLRLRFAPLNAVVRHLHTPMLIVRFLLILICALFALLVVAAELSSEAPTLVSGLAMLAAVFIAFILILGPFWPNAARIQKLKLILNRVLGVENAIPVVLCAVLGLFTVWSAWDTYVNPTTRELHGIERLIVAVVGSGTLPIFLLLLGVYLLWKAYDFFKRSRAG